MPKKLLSKDAGIKLAREALESFDSENQKSFLEKVVHLIRVTRINRRYFEDAFPNDQSAIQRALNAAKMHRDIGQIGRPPVLNSKESELLLTRIDLENKNHKHCFSGRVNELAEDILKQREDTKQNQTKDQEIKILHEANHYDIAMIFNFDETPLRLSSSIRKLVFFTDNFPPSPLAAPPRMPNATVVLYISASGNHLTTFLLWPSLTIPEELRGLLARDFQIICDGKGWMTTDTLCNKILPVWEKEINETRASLGLSSEKLE
ncbi:MAG: hypothetical protein EZS28_035061 [Streblomastix strix]|uniref:DDE-1 domain-containing protein n=1 Tax=Streblomastix strix TaxID=222440 RepID=A0A5J4UGQ8_9EUKA|nr:MAG: hypothetical protein EZS28_035061 [Streblomastix strix]